MNPILYSAILLSEIINIDYYRTFSPSAFHVAPISTSQMQQGTLPKVVLKLGPYGSLPRGGGSGNVCTERYLSGREARSPVAEKSPSLCFACLVGVAELQRGVGNVFFPFFKIHFNPSHSWKNHNPSSSLQVLQF